jgi:hypothetical protein
MLRLILCLLLEVQYTAVILYRRLRNCLDNLFESHCNENTAPRRNTIHPPYCASATEHSLEKYVKRIGPLDISLRERPV